MSCAAQSDEILRLSAFVDAEVDYHRQSVDVLERLLESLRERSVTCDVFVCNVMQCKIVNL